MRFVGRAVELGALAGHARAVVDERRLRVVLLIAEPGRGASGLLEEFHRRTPGLRYVRVAPPRAAGAPALWPWQRVLADLGSPSAVDDVWSAQAALSQVFAEAGPVLVALDDLHRAAEETLTLLAEYADQPSATPTLVVAVVRPAVAETLPSGPAAYRVWLPGLSRDEVGEMLAGSVAWPVPEALATQLRRRTDGSPALLTAIAGQLRESDDGRRRVALRWPESATAPITGRLAALTEPARHVLGIASVVGREFDLSIVEEVAGDAALPALEEAITAGLIRPVTDRVFAFDSALVRELSYDALGLTETAGLHEAVADALLSVGARAGERAPTVAELSHHLVAAAVLGGDERLDRAVAATVASARAAERPAEAADAFAVAVELASRAQWSPGHLGRLLVAYGSAQLQSAHREQARNAFAAAVRLGRQAKDAGLLAEAALAYGPRSGSGATAEPTDPQRATALTEALALLNSIEEADVSTVARLRARLALESTGAAARTLAEQSLAAARECADPRAMAEALLAQVEPDADQLRQALREAGALDDGVLLSRAHRAVAALSLRDGDLGLADRHLAEVDGVPEIAAHRLVLAGKAAAAREHLAVTADLEGLAAYAGLRLLDGDPGDLGDRLRDVGGPLWITAAQAWIARADGRDELAGALIEELAAQPLDPWTIAFVVAAEPDAAAADRLGALLSAYQGKWIVAGPATASAGPTALMAARLEADPKRATAWLDDATRVVGHTPWLAWLRWERARLRADAQDVKSARTFAAERGLSGLVRRIDRFEPPDGRTLTRREQEVLELAAAGASAREIAERLVIGERTVETHLANIYRKLGVRSRVELVAHLRDSGRPV
ncbi:LuxR C-terminal-related transcriptional regulator [Hamadaea sp. NPDC051192]|uniref:helix-turn-helix transcriptional regulator n=1 Tax=Hamadaea sp. NPDC051192 TaxID=3154940 RepID=UPI00342A7861